MRKNYKILAATVLALSVGMLGGCANSNEEQIQTTTAQETTIATQTETQVQETETETEPVTEEPRQQLRNQKRHQLLLQESIMAINGIKKPSALLQAIRHQ